MLLALGWPFAGWSEVRYSVQDLGKFNADKLTVCALVEGIYGNQSYSWQAGFGLLNIPPLPGGYGVQSHGVNASGEVVGYADVDHQPRRAFVWDRVAGTRPLTDFGKDQAGHNISSEAYGINDFGDVVGRYYHDDTYDSYYFDKSTGTLRTLDRLAAGYGTEAMGVNNRGWAFGIAGDGTSGVGVVWHPDGSVHFLGLMLNQTQTDPFSINDKNHVVGGTYGPMGFVGFFWADGVFTPVTNSVKQNAYIAATDINESDTVVGTMYKGYNLPTAFVWTKQTGSLALNDMLDASGAGWDLQQAYGINDKGQICGTGLHNGQNTGFLLTPHKTGILPFGPPIRKQP